MGGCSASGSGLEGFRTINPKLNTHTHRDIARDIDVDIEIDIDEDID